MLFHTICVIKMKFSVVCFLGLIGVCLARPYARWTNDKAKEWQKVNGWKAGSNFVPSTAVNELEMFQKETYDPVTIDRELQLAEDLGFTVMRVFLHNLLWSDSGSNVDLFKRLDDFLDIATKHHIKIMFVLFDSCWNPYPKIGSQPEPIPGVHNSQWVQSPGYDITQNKTLFATMESYVTGIVSYYKDDSRVLLWDIWNEPNNSNYDETIIADRILTVVDWVRGVNPSQPLTTCIWHQKKNGHYTWFQQLQLDNSDIISFHNYESEDKLAVAIADLQKYSKNRPILCSEYMARPANSTFQPHLQLMKDENVVAINWGFVSGRTQTIYSWETNTVPATEEPAVWFHDIWRANGTAFDVKEVSFIKSVTGVMKGPLPLK